MTERIGKAMALAAICLLPVKLAHAVDVEIDTFSVSTQWEILDPFGFSETISLSGSAQQQVFFETNTGQALDDDLDGLDDVGTELVSLNLSGSSSLFGTVTVALNSASPTLGQIEERINNTAGILDVPPFATTGIADVYFDMFIDLTLGSLTMTNVSPLQLSGATSSKPATTEEYGLIFGNFPPVTFTDSQGFNYQVTGRVASVPEPGSLSLALLCLALITFMQSPQSNVSSSIRTGSWSRLR